MSLTFFMQRFDLDESLSLNLTEFENYLIFLRGSDIYRCATTSELFDAAGIEDRDAILDDVPLLLALSTSCVLNVTCGANIQVEVGEETYHCNDQPSGMTNRGRGTDDHDHQHEVEDVVHVLLGDSELDCFLEEETPDTENRGNFGARVWLKVLGITLAITCISFVGVFSFFFNLDSDGANATFLINLALSFAAGILLWVTFGHLAPESVEHIGDEQTFGMYLILGIVIAAGVEFTWPLALGLFSSQEIKEVRDEILSEFEEIQAGAKGDLPEEEQHEPVPQQIAVVEQPNEARIHGHGHGIHANHNIKDKGATIANILLGDFLHNFVDGILIALAYTLCEKDTGLGITVSIGIAAHEIPQEVSDFLVLMRCGLSFWKALWLNFLSGCSALIGAIVILGTGEIEERVQGILLAVSCGILSFIVLAELFPLMQETARTNTALLWAGLFFCLGIVLGIVMSLIPDQHCEA